MDLKCWRRRKIENTDARNGMICTCNVSDRWRYFVTRTKFGMTVASAGIMYVARKSRNRKFLPLNSRRANAYAARIDVMSSPIVAATMMIAVFVKKVCHGASPHAVAKFSKWNSSGNSVGGNWVASKKLLVAVESIQ